MIWFYRIQWWFDSKLRHKAWYRKWRGLPEPITWNLQRHISGVLAILERQLQFTASIDKDFIEAFDKDGAGTVTVRKPTRYASPRKEHE